MKSVYDFLSLLRDNNCREWFADHKEQYRSVQATHHAFAQRLLDLIATFDSEVSHLSVKDCTYRIYRDIRFSADKRPFKTHMGIFINPPYGKRINTGGYYIHIEPGHSMICAGTIGLEPKIIKAVRQAIFDNIDEYRDIVESAEFRKCFDHLGDNFLKTTPKGFPKDWPHIDYIRPRDFIAMRRIDDRFLCDDNAIEALLPYLVQAKRFNDFINYTIEDFIDGDDHSPLPHIY